ncbi:SCO0607 family lipoprotein [Actinoplanes sp. URMC 104]|uniref:SCO0607 family lipoprotein n=1 Tax=Actinoplanes sp. URMC 104 TaxID=3423409 RepID=UPI003F1B6919
MVLRRIPYVVLTATLAGGLAGGCSLREAICGSGEYPVAAVDSLTGRACVPEGEEPPVGYVRFPAGKEPRHVDDEWDKYWSKHKLDEHGNETP